MFIKLRTRVSRFHVNISSPIFTVYFFNVITMVCYTESFLVGQQKSPKFHYNQMDSTGAHKWQTYIEIFTFLFALSCSVYKIYFTLIVGDIAVGV